MQRPCDSCGREYEAKRPRSRFCGATCRQRAARAPAPVPHQKAVATAPLTTPLTGLADVTRREMEAAGRLNTTLGQQAVALAARIESPMETGASVASLSRELRAVMAEAMQGVAVARDPMDELRARRDLKRIAG